MPTGAWLILVGSAFLIAGFFTSRKTIKQIISGDESIGQRIFSEVTNLLTPVSGATDRISLGSDVVVTLLGLILSIAGIFSLSR